MVVQQWWLNNVGLFQSRWFGNNNPTVHLVHRHRWRHIWSPSISSRGTCCLEQLQCPQSMAAIFSIEKTWRGFHHGFSQKKNHGSNCRISYKKQSIEAWLYSTGAKVDDLQRLPCDLATPTKSGDLRRSWGWIFPRNDSMVVSCRCMVYHLPIHFCLKQTFIITHWLTSYYPLILPIIHDPFIITHWLKSPNTHWLYHITTHPWIMRDWRIGQL